MGKKDKKRAMSREDADEDEETVSKKRLKLSTKESKSKKAEDKLKNQIVSAETKPTKSKKPKATSTPKTVHVSESESESDAQSPRTYATEQIVSAETKSTKSRKSKSTPTPKPVEPVSESESESDAQPPYRYTADAVFNINRSKASAVVAATTDSSDDSSGAKSLPQTNDKRRTNESTIVRQPMSSSKQNKISNKKPPVSSHTDNSDTEERTHKTGDLDDNIWPSEHLTELINRIERLVPEDDTLSYKTRAEHIDWAKVAFNVHTGQQCKDQWDLISKRLRGFRILKELLEDAHAWASKPWTDFYKVRKTEDLNNPVTNNADVVIKHRTTETTTIMDIKNNYSAIFARTQISNSPAKSQENVNFNNRKIFGKHCTNTPPASFRQKECLTRDININLNLKRFADDENDSIVKHKNGLLLNSQMKPKNLTEVDPKLIGVDEKQKVLVIQCTENSDEDIVYSTPGAETKPYYSILSTNIVLKPRDLHEEFDVPSSIKIEPESQSAYDSCVQQTDVAENVEATLPQFVEIGCEPWEKLNKSKDRLKEHEFIKEPHMPPESPFLLFAKKIKSTPENAVREWNLMKLYKRQKYASQLKKMLKVYNNKYWKYLHSLDEIQLVQYITNEDEDVFEVLNKLHGNEAHV